MSNLDFAIQLPQFSGPFDLLLFFIERDELNIHDIPISKISNDFLEYIHRSQIMNIELAGEFILTAATLMRIKAKMLIPRPEIGASGQEIDPRKELAEKLIEYKKIKDATVALRQMETEQFMQKKRGNIEFDLQQMVSYARPTEELQNLSLYRLLSTYEKVMRRVNEKDRPEVKHTITFYSYTIEAQKEIILNLFSSNLKEIDFPEIRSISLDKVQLVYNLLAILELLQQQILDIRIGMGFNNFWLAIKNQA